MSDKGHRGHRRREAFTLPELALVILILAVFVWIMTAIATRTRRPRRDNLVGCVSNQRHIALAILSYAQDHDQHLPPGSGLVPVEQEGGAAFSPPRFMTGSWGPDRTWHDGTVIPGLLRPYFRSRDFVTCPNEPESTIQSEWVQTKLTYLYNDLVTGESLDRMRAPGATVLITDGEMLEDNVGHAWIPGQGPWSARLGPDGRPGPDQGATVRDALHRHQGGATFAFTDGHTKWFKVTYEEGVGTPGRSKTIYFPPRESDRRTAGKRGSFIEPKPGGDMRGFAGTFHVR